MLANRIALLKQEEMKTWKKIEETKKRTSDVVQLKVRNEDRIQKVSSFLTSENSGCINEFRKQSQVIAAKLHFSEAEARRKKENTRSHILIEERRSQTD